MKIAILIKLESKTERKIKTLKSFFKKRHNTCLYVDDFPHLTLSSVNVKLNMNELRKINLKIKIKDIKIDISIPQVFREDLLTGGTTFFFRVKKNQKLFDLQTIISNSFKKYLDKIKTNNNFKKNSQEYKSLKKYGFPYVGKHWIPHVSICSVIDKNINQKAYKKFINTKINSTFYINELFLCAVGKKNLITIKKIKFNN